MKKFPRYPDLFVSQVNIAFQMRCMIDFIFVFQAVNLFALSWTWNGILRREFLFFASAAVQTDRLDVVSPVSKGNKAARWPQTWCDGTLYRF